MIHNRIAIALAAAVAFGLLWLALPGLRGSSPDGTPTAIVTRGDLTIAVVESGVLRAARSLTYHSPLAGREAELTFLAPEGLYVGEGDLVATLDTTELARELERAIQGERQAGLEERIAVADAEEARAELDSATDGEKALELEDAEAKLRLMQRKVFRLQEEHDGLKPLLAKGYITREEIDRSAMELEQARADAEGLRRRVTMMRNRAYPREQRRAQVVLEQRTAQVESARQRHVESNALVASLRTAIDASHIYTKCAGLVVYEEFLTANPRRKVRVGDRVTATQGLVTIPELDAMLLDTSVRESDIARIQTGQVVGIEVDAFRSTKFRGRVTAIGALGRTSIDRPFEEKRFDVTIAVEGSDHQLRPEMTARATIVVDERKQALLIPVSALFEASGRRVVYVIRHGRHEVRRVTIGQSDDVQVEITGGLEAGELVALTDGAGSLLTLSTRP